ncbi:MBL fold metallo-hydrolase [Halomarina oriensis]|uniref:MBL fold metallo-hydrolase n=1 Tax=Halomarina oriensis TaxID=671145 RepID=A0A6B0GPT3_9EURY|nr:MBL fold metallo-hydrolase [Halomarina oriensis]
MTIRHEGLVADWFGYATLRLESTDSVVYLDPGRYGVLTGEWRPDSSDVGHPDPVDYDARDGDVVCVTHDHHYDSDAVRRVAGEDATVVAFEAVDADAISRDVDPLEDLPYDVERVGYGDTVTVAGVEVTVTEAYNDPDGPHTRDDRTPFHPDGFGCGFHVELGGTTAFWPGDSDALDSHEAVDCSLFCPPIGGSFTMDRHEAAVLAATLEPDLVLPIHYNTFDALETESGAFAADVASRGVPVVLDES